MLIRSTYHPGPKQSQFHRALALFKLFLAGIGSGKSLCGVHEAAKLAQDNPHSDGMIVAPTHPMMRDIIIPLWYDWIPRELWTHLKADNQIIWRPTGRKIYLRSATNPESLRGPNLAWVWLDEAAMILRRRIWDILIGRVRDPRANRRQTFATTTPAGWNWLVKIFQKGDHRYHVTRARTRDNKHLPDDFEAALRAQYGDEFSAQELDAEIVDMGGITWPINGRVHCALTLGEMRKQITKGYFGGVDWGHTNPAAILIGGLDADLRWYLVDAWYKRGQDREVIAAQAAKMKAKWGVRYFYADHDPEGIRWMKRKGCSVMQAEKDVISGVQFVRSLLPVRKDGKPRMYIGRWLKDWHREQEGYQMPEGEEEPEGMNGDHLMDATRYLTYTHSLKPMDGGYQSVERTGWN